MSSISISSYHPLINKVNFSFQMSRRSYVDYAPQKTEQVSKSVLILFKLGDTGSSDLSQAVTDLCAEYNKDKDQFISAWKSCLPQYPFKTTLFATVAALVNARQFDMGADVIQVAGLVLNEALHTSNFRTVKLMV